MNIFSEQTSAEVAEEAESERAGHVNTLDQLRQNLRPENMVDEMLSQAQANSSNFMDKVWSVARANPVPATLIGLGAAMLMNASQRIRKQSDLHEPAWATTETEFAAQNGHAAWNDKPTRHTGLAMHTYSPRKRGALARLFDEQPLILAALGVAVGAAVGSAIPSTEVEAQWMGDASDSVRRNAGAMAREQLSQLRSTAGETLDQMKATAAEHGISTDNVSGLVHDLGENVRSAAQTAATRTGQTLSY